MCGLGPASADWPLDFLWKMFNSCDLLSVGFLLTIKSISILLAHRTNGRWVVQLSCYLPKRSSRKPLDESLEPVRRCSGMRIWIALHQLIHGQRLLRFLTTATGAEWDISGRWAAILSSCMKYSISGWMLTGPLICLVSSRFNGSLRWTSLKIRPRYEPLSSVWPACWPLVLTLRMEPLKRRCYLLTDLLLDLHLVPLVATNRILASIQRQFASWPAPISNLFHFEKKKRRAAVGGSRNEVGSFFTWFAFDLAIMKQIES